MNDQDHPLAETDGGDRQFVTALARGLDILSCYRADDRFLTNHEIATRTGLAKPTISRLTHTLTKTGHLLRDDDSGAYRLSARCLNLGFSVISAISITERFKAGFAAFASGPNPYVTAVLAEASGSRAVCVGVSRSQQAVSLTMNVGARLPLFYTAVGRAIIVGMTEAERAEALRLGTTEFPKQAARMEQGIRDAISDYESYGYCTGFGDWKPEINGIAAPLISADGTTVYGVNIGGPSFLISTAELHAQYGPVLLKAVDNLGGTKAPR